MPASREIITVPNLLEAILRGPKSDRLFELVSREVRRTIDAQASIVKPLVAIAVGSRRFQTMKQAAATKAAQRVPDTFRFAEEYAVNALDVRNTIVERMRTWRVEADWWKDGVARDYLTLRTADGLVCDVYGDRRSGAWWLQRVLD